MLIGGRIDGSARAIRVFPAPGGPTISMLWTKDYHAVQHDFQTRRAISDCK
jgi:hypothetical protein